MDAVEPIDEEVWSELVAVIGAAHALDREGFGAVMSSAGARLPLREQQKMGLYLWYLLRQVLGRMAGGRVPTDAELELISQRYGAKFRRLVKGDSILLGDTFRKVFERKPVLRDIGAGGLLVLGSAALGVLCDNPDEELAALKPKLDSWWREHSESLYRKGMLR